jgi:two-component system, chemotaxis family, response regulator WspF
VKIAVTNATPEGIEAIRAVLAGMPRHRIVWTENDGARAVTKCTQDKPDLVLVDLDLSSIDGVRATKMIMERSPCAILIVTADADAKVTPVFHAMSAGALGAVATPRLGVEADAVVLRAKVAMVARMLGESESTGATRDLTMDLPDQHGRMLAIGSSAGGPGALPAILSQLPPDFPAAVVIVQHVDAEFAAGLATWLGDQCALPVSLAKSGERPQAGRVVIAGGREHLIVDRGGRLANTPEPQTASYKPSIDVFFESAARRWRGDIIGIVLTGMGRDGAQGLKLLRNGGHHTIAQDRATSAVYGMPKAAAELDAAAEILPLGEIAATLRRRWPPLRDARGRHRG